MFGTKEQIEEARKNPKFSYVKLGECWSKHQGNDGGFTLNWGVEHLGFGQLAFYKKGSNIYCDSEHMSKDFIQKTFLFFLEKEIVYRDK